MTHDSNSERLVANKAIRYVAEPTHVREISLLGTADLVFWKNCLMKEELVPAEREGNAQIMIIAADMKFLGVRFTEISFCILLADHERNATKPQPEGRASESLECGDLSPFFAGDLSPSRPGVARSPRTAERFAVWRTNPPDGQSGDKSPHSKVFAVRDELNPVQHRAFLLQAVNSCRLFAFCERAIFATPYQHGDCKVSACSPISIRLIRGGEVVFWAEMQAGSSVPTRQPLRSGQDGWEGPVFLPATGRRRGDERQLYFARIKGYTRAYPFVRGEDALSIRPSADIGIFQALLDSRFAGQEWLVREDATHGRSKTYRRSETFPSHCRPLPA